ncbi:hypothetical protein [Legionella sp.]|uniref:hypothetical protein n=1 Tax=Legionella sp. TaxID=459 RepID=UPI003D14AFA6
MKDDVQRYLFNDFLENPEDLEDIHPYFIAKKLTISNLMYELQHDLLSIEADYLLKLELDNSRIVLDDEVAKEKRFKERKASGSFGIKIDQNKKIHMEHCDIDG